MIKSNATKLKMSIAKKGTKWSQSRKDSRKGIPWTQARRDAQINRNRMENII